MLRAFHSCSTTAFEYGLGLHSSSDDSMCFEKRNGQEWNFTHCLRFGFPQQINKLFVNRNVFALKTVHFQREPVKFGGCLYAEYLINQLHEAKVMSCRELTELLCKLMDTDD